MPSMQGNVVKIPLAHRSGQGVLELHGLVLIYTYWGTGPKLSHSMNDHLIFLSALKPLNKSQLKSMEDFHHFQGYRPKKLDAWRKSRQGKRKGRRKLCCCNVMDYSVSRCE